MRSPALLRRRARSESRHPLEDKGKHCDCEIPMEMWPTGLNVAKGLRALDSFEEYGFDNPSMDMDNSA